ncbi:MAG: lamin tail domain-containing protein [Planctomycetota bacterium]
MTEMVATKAGWLNVVIAAIASGIVLAGCGSLESAPAGLPMLYINEFMANNDTAVQDPDGSGGYPDWIELYNAGDSAVDLGGMYLTDDLNQPRKWRIPDGVSIDAGGYLLFWADNDPEQGDTHASFKLAWTGEAVGLFDTDANGNVAIDTLIFEEQSADVSFGRTTDGADAWQALTTPTPGGSNN